MAQIFPRSANALARGSILVGLFSVLALGGAVFTLARSGYVTRQGLILEQPVPFSHDHHVGQIGIDCRYCHTAVETSSSAGIPPIATCMNCQDGTPLRWNKVNDLPDFVYFNHSIHVAKGVACTTCHGQVDKMPLMYQAESLQMDWCLACHRDPVKNLRPREEVTNVLWQPPANLPELQRDLATRYNVKSKTSCSTCHR